MTSVESQLSVFTPSLVSLHLSPSLAGGVRLVGCVSSPVSPHLSSVVSLYLFLLFLSFVSQCASAARLSGCSGVWLSASLSVPVSPHLSPRLASGVRLSRCLSLLVSLRLSGCVSFLVSLHSFPNVPMLVSGSLFPGCPGVIGRAAPRMSFFTCLLLCHAVQLSNMINLPEEVIPAAKLPSLTSFETSLRTTTPNRATGLDLVPAGVHHEHAPIIARFFYALLLKIHIWCTEPIQFKGGVMCLIHKKGSVTEACNYRGILLLASIAKRIHSLNRATLMRSLEPHRAEGQLGGFSNQMVQFGFHTVCTWTRILGSQGVSTAVLYLDLKSAFHHMIREFALGISNPEDFEQILVDLRAAGHPLEATRHGRRLVGALETIGCDARVLRLLRDIHTDTWFTISTSELVRTKRGTRPGSPLADAIFHVAMAQLITEVRQWLFTQTAFIELLQVFDLPVLTVVWADDVAIPWASSTATELVPQICQLVQNVERIFAQKGFTINFGLQKTNAVITFQGTCAPALRRQYLLHQLFDGSICYSIDLVLTASLNRETAFGFIFDQRTSIWALRMQLRRRSTLSSALGLVRPAKLWRPWGGLS